MDNILQTLHQLEGVNGTMVADANGKIIAYRAHSVYDSELLQQVARVVVSSIDSLKLMQDDWESISTQFSEGKLLVRNLSVGDSHSGNYTLSVIADTRLNLSFAGVAIRVAAAKLKIALESNGGAPVAAAPAPGGSAKAVHSMNAVASSVGSMPAASQPKPPMAEVATSGLSWSGFGTSSTAAASGVAVADPASASLLTNCTKALAMSVGPMAKLFVKEGVRKVCPDHPFSKTDLRALISELEKQIEDPRALTSFRQAASKLL